MLKLTTRCVFTIGLLTLALGCSPGARRDSLPSPESTALLTSPTLRSQAAPPATSTSAAPAVTPRPTSRTTLIELPTPTALTYEWEGPAGPARCEGCLVFVSNVDGNNEVYLIGMAGPELRITYNPANDTDPSISPGGYLLAFASDRSGDFDLFAANTDLTGFVNLTDGPSNDREPDWSPDGTKIVFRSDRDGGQEIYVLNLLDNSIDQLTENSVDDLDPSWSPNGEWIAFTTWAGGSYDIFAIRPDGSSMTQITCDQANDGFPSWSPDGARIAFHSDREGNSDIFLASFGGGGHGCGETQFTQLTRDTSDDMVPTWSAGAIWFMTSRFGTFDLAQLPDPSLGANDDRALRFADTRGALWNWHETFDGFPSASPVDDFTGAMAFSIPSSVLRPLTEPWLRTSGGVWSHDAERIAFVSERGGAPAVYVMDADGGDIHSLVDLTGEQLAPSWLPAWSPVGEWLAFLARRQDGHDWLHLLNLDQGVARPIFELVAGQYGGGLTWSPDGAEVALVAWGEYQRDPVMIRISVERGEIIATRQGVVEATYSPDGTRLALAVRQADGYQLITVDRQTGVERIIRQWPNPGIEAIGSVRWSPDGTKLAYVRFRDIEFSATEYEMNSIGADGRDNRILTDLWGASNPVWLPDGQFIVFESYEPGAAPKIMRADGSDIQRLSAHPAALESTGLALSPDGRSLLFTSFVTGAPSLYVLRIPEGYSQGEG